MTGHEKTICLNMRRSGASYARIASTLGVSASAVKSFCRRFEREARIQDETEPVCKVCKQCGKSIAQTRCGKPKKFCSDACRMAWWSANRDSLQKRAVYYFTCAQCGVNSKVTATNAGSTAATPAISPTATERMIAMTRTQFERERDYHAAIAFARALLAKQLLSAAEYRKIETALQGKFRPILSA